MELVEIVDLLRVDDGLMGEDGGFEIGFRQINGGNLVIMVGCVIKDAFVKVVAGGVERVFVLVVAEIAATILLFDRVKDMEELVDAGKLVAGGEGIKLGEGGFGKAGFG